MKNRYRNITTIVNRGADICQRIKDIIHPEQPWSPILSDRIANEFSLCKVECRKFNPDFDNDEKLFVWMMSLPDCDYVAMVGNDISGRPDGI